jgi:hypothetical protein
MGEVYAAHGREPIAEKFFMPTTLPIAAAGERRPKGAKGLPANVKAAIRALVWGVENDEGPNPSSLAEAAKAGDMKADTLRRWLARPETRAAIADERTSFLAWATSANAAVLSAIRDYGSNEAAKVRAIALLEEMAGLRSAGTAVQVNVQTNVSNGQFRGYHYAPCDRPVIEAKAEPARIDRPEHPNVVSYRQREARDFADDRRREEEERLSFARVFDPGPGYFRP